MATKLIRLADKTLVEVEVRDGEGQQISASVAAKVDKTLDQLQAALIRACRPVAAAWTELNKDMFIEQAEVELSFGFEGEGNIYVTKFTGSANIVVKLTLKAPSSNSSSRD